MLARLSFSLLALFAALATAQRTKVIKNGEMLDLTGGRKQETDFSKEVIRMFNAISSNRPEEINAAIAALPRGAIDIRGPSGNTPLFESVLKVRSPYEIPPSSISALQSPTPSTPFSVLPF